MRDLQALEDDIKLAVFDACANCARPRIAPHPGALRELACRRVRSASLNLEAGRLEIRDLLEAQEDLYRPRTPSPTGQSTFASLSSRSNEISGF